MQTDAYGSELEENACAGRQTRKRTNARGLIAAGAFIVPRFRSSFSQVCVCRWCWLLRRCGSRPAVPIFEHIGYFARRKLRASWRRTIPKPSKIQKRNNPYPNTRGGAIGGNNIIRIHAAGSRIIGRGGGRGIRTYFVSMARLLWRAI